MAVKPRTKWYAGGLHFECRQCGRCCAGLSEGYIWITKPEIEMLADHLGVTVDDLRRSYVIHIGARSTIIEEPRTNDCVFLTKTKSGRGCSIYLVRPNQCRTWPFWSYNLASPDDWNMVGVKCHGINRGRLYSFDEIERLRRQRRWWDDGN